MEIAGAVLGAIASLPITIFATTVSILLAHRVEGRISMSKIEDANKYWRLRRKFHYKLHRAKVVCPHGHPLA